MRLQEGPYLPHRNRNPLLGLFPGIHAHFRFGCEHRRLHGDGVGMRRNIVGKDQYRCLAIADEIACHGEDESGLVRYILVRYFWTISIVMSGRRFTKSGPQPVMLPS